ncbi:hypothetical protein [Stackebrandtia nassauensis]|uniref:Alkaline shock response membrane anchor protein AmaP n=1 Tax=Stackebrandtia nassauensis (strain DSM 44728 / CIP 108903 / NRRL B-16338 / NBRC 102104 / LLR-40K-21) TaxID=446470 RepID=D3Q3S5_STANL|nr:hypothetical protein [Stackebrandtia nassauensis]ADD43992.1 hypothetical protein Snas_4345 [Stackebrandtia nassauensis DSM 44728]
MTDGANRALWIIVGLVLAAVGGLGVAAHSGRLRFADPDDPLLSGAVIDLWHRGDPWNLAVVIVLGLLLVIVGIVLFGREFRRRGTSRIDDLSHPGERGDTVVRAAALINCLERDVATGRGIVKVSATITGHTDSPRVWLWVGLAPGATVTQAREHVDESLRRFTTTSGITPGSVDVTVLPTAKAQARVR